MAARTLGNVSRFRSQDFTRPFFLAVFFCIKHDVLSERGATKHNSLFYEMYTYSTAQTYSYHLLSRFLNFPRAAILVMTSLSCTFVSNKRTSAFQQRRQRSDVMKSKMAARGKFKGRNLFHLLLLLMLRFPCLVNYRPLQKRERTGKEYGCFPFV